MSKLAIVHLRNYKSYERPPKNNGGATLVYKIEDDKYVIALAICHKKESYNKKRGIEIATKRFERGKVCKIPCSVLANGKQRVSLKILLEDILSHKHLIEEYLKRYNGSHLYNNLMKSVSDTLKRYKLILGAE